jgi:hypothetical protein
MDGIASGPGSLFESSEMPKVDENGGNFCQIHVSKVRDREPVALPKDPVATSRLEGSTATTRAPMLAGAGGAGGAEGRDPKLGVGSGRLCCRRTPRWFLSTTLRIQSTEAELWGGVLQRQDPPRRSRRRAELHSSYGLRYSDPPRTSFSTSCRPAGHFSLHQGAIPIRSRHSQWCRPRLSHR